MATRAKPKSKPNRDSKSKTKEKSKPTSKKAPTKIRGAAEPTGVTTKQRDALVALATDLSRGDPKVIAQMKAALENPPRTTEEVGYYVSGSNNPFENCFRKLASLLSKSPYAMTVEDKYVYELFEQWTAPGRLKKLPAAFREMLPEWFGVEPEAEDDDQAAEAREQLRKGYVKGVQAVEKAFVDLGTPLLSFDTGGGDTMVFIQATPKVAQRWQDTKVGETHDGVPLAVRSPMWDVLWANIDYAADLELGDPPKKLPSRRLHKL